MKSLDYWLWFSLKKGISNARKVELLLQYDSLEVLYHMDKKALKREKLTRKEMRLLSDKDMTEAELTKERCMEIGIRILTYDSAFYPERLKQIADPPIVLYVRSKERINLNDKICIGMVGNRYMTTYGELASLQIAGGLAEAGVVTVSGMARGIDSASHRGSLLKGGKTVAVLGCGADVVYPPENGALMQNIIENGMVVTEYPPGTPPIGKHFPVRNRLISGLSEGVVVVEAPKKSGSLITADLALKQNRDVFAVPGDITRKQSLGCNKLISQGAILVNDASDILKEYELLYRNTLKQYINHSKEQQNAIDTVAEEMPKLSSPMQEVSLHPAYSGLSDIQKRIVSALSINPIHVEALSALTGLTLAELATELMLLEIDGIVKSLPGKHFVLHV